MMAFRISVVILCILFHYYEGASIGNKDFCSKLIFKLSLFSQRQENGKWETHVELNKGNTTEDSEHEKDLHLDVKQTIATCNCTKDVLSVEANIIAPPPRPSKNYTLYAGHGYYFLQKLLQQSEEANFLCNNEGAHLAVINSKDEADIVKKVIQDTMGHDSANKEVFVGLYKQAGENIITVYGDAYEVPDGIIQENDDRKQEQDNFVSLCGTINVKGNLKFVPCQWKLPSICEQEL
ncbi:hypothetical protein R5R35_011328 [Gryllus longicercus]|uniref:C-type lectin domain-containing protein n=1 Tax=Gryllus longicercus TaxID=2509291 RepID=A0AAN9ZHQ6_9ORTH